MTSESCYFSLFRSLEAWISSRSKSFIELTIAVAVFSMYMVSLFEVIFDHTRDIFLCQEALQLAYGILVVLLWVVIQENC